jgi:hypothetical protein
MGRDSNAGTRRRRVNCFAAARSSCQNTAIVEPIMAPTTTEAGTLSE